MTSVELICLAGTQNPATALSFRFQEGRELLGGGAVRAYPHSVKSLLQFRRFYHLGDIRAIFATTSVGVFKGANTPYQPSTSNPRNLVAIGGTPGNRSLGSL